MNVNVYVDMYVLLCMCIDTGGGKSKQVWCGSNSSCLVCKISNFERASVQKMKLRVKRSRNRLGSGGGGGNARGKKKG